MKHTQPFVSVQNVLKLSYLSSEQKEAILHIFAYFFIMKLFFIHKDLLNNDKGIIRWKILKGIKNIIYNIVVIVIVIVLRYFSLLNIILYTKNYSY